MAYIQIIIKSGKESLELSGKLMEIDINTGVLKVYHNDKKLRGLIGKTAKTVIKDSKQLQEPGFKVPKQIVQGLDTTLVKLSWIVFKMASSTLYSIS